MKARKNFGRFDKARNVLIEKIHGQSKIYFIAPLDFSDYLSKSDVSGNSKFVYG